MRRRLHVFLLLALVVLFGGMLLQPRQAIASEADGLSVTIEADSSTYKKGDTATFTVTMTNEAVTPVTDATYSVSLPDGMRPSEGSEVEGSVEKIYPGETVTRTVNAYVWKDAASTTPGASSGSSGSQETGTVEEVDETDGTDGAEGTILQTGDNSLLIVAAVGLAGAVLVIAAFVIKRKHGLSAFCLLLCLAMAFASFSNVSTAYADELVAGQANASCNVSISGDTYKVNVAVSYYSTEQTPNPGVGANSGGSVMYEFKDDVTVINNFEQLGDAYLLDSDHGLTVGSEVAFVGADADEMAVGAVTGIEQVGDKTSIAIDQATDPNEVFKYIAIDYGTPVDLSDVEFIDGVTVKQSAPQSRAKLDLPTIEIDIDCPLENDGKIRASMEMSSWIDVKFDWSLWSGLKNANVEFDSTTDFSATGVSPLGSDGSIQINKEPIKIPLSNGANIKVNLNLDYTLEGTISVTASFDTSAGVRYKDGKLSPYADVDSSTSFNLEIEATVGIGPAATLSLGKFELVDVQISIGPAGDAKKTLRDTGMICSDISVYAYLDVSSGNNTWWMKQVGLTLTAKFWTSENSPLRWNLHAENGELVDSCTYTADKPGEKPSEEPDNPGEGETGGESTVTPDDEFVFEENINGNYAVVDYIGDSDSIVIPSQHNGRDVEDVLFVSEQGSYATTVRSIAFEEGSKAKAFRYFDEYSTNNDGTSGLTTADFSNACDLETIVVTDSGTLQKLDVSGLKHLTSLGYYCHLADGFEQRPIAFSGVVLKDNTALEQLGIEDIGGHVRTLNLAEAPALKTLTLTGLGLESIDLSGNLDLKSAWLHNNSLSSLDVSGNEKLEYLVCDDNKIYSLKLPVGDTLGAFYASNNQIRFLDLSGCTGLMQMGIDNNLLSSLDLSKNVKLTWVDVSSNQLSNLDVSGLSDLAYLYCDRNDLAELDISTNGNLATLNCSHNNLTSLSAEGFRKLLNDGKDVSIRCSYNSIENIEELADLAAEYGYEWDLDPQSIQ